MSKNTLRDSQQTLPFIFTTHHKLNYQDMHTQLQKPPVRQRQVHESKRPTNIQQKHVDQRPEAQRMTQLKQLAATRARPEDQKHDQIQALADKRPAAQRMLQLKQLAATRARPEDQKHDQLQALADKRWHQQRGSIQAKENEAPSQKPQETPTPQAIQPKASGDMLSQLSEPIAAKVSHAFPASAPRVSLQSGFGGMGLSQGDIGDGQLLGASQGNHIALRPDLHREVTQAKPSPMAEKTLYHEIAHTTDVTPTPQGSGSPQVVYSAANEARADAMAEKAYKGVRAEANEGRQAKSGVQLKMTSEEKEDFEKKLIDSANKIKETDLVTRRVRWMAFVQSQGNAATATGSHVGHQALRVSFDYAIELVTGEIKDLVAGLDAALDETEQDEKAIERLRAKLGISDDALDELKAVKKRAQEESDTKKTKATAGLGKSDFKNEYVDYVTNFLEGQRAVVSENLARIEGYVGEDFPGIQSAKAMVDSVKALETTIKAINDLKSIAQIANKWRSTTMSGPERYWINTYEAYKEKIGSEGGQMFILNLVKLEALKKEMQVEVNKQPARLRAIPDEDEEATGGWSNPEQYLSGQTLGAVHTEEGQMQQLAQTLEHHMYLHLINVTVGGEPTWSAFRLRVRRDGIIGSFLNWSAGRK